MGDQNKCNDYIEKEKYIETLKQEIDNLKSQLKVTEEDRDEAKLGLQRMIARCAKLIAEKESKNVEDVYAEIAENIRSIIEG